MEEQLDIVRRVIESGLKEAQSENNSEMIDRFEHILTEYKILKNQILEEFSNIW